MMSQAVRAVLTVSLLLPASVAIAGPSDGDLGFSAEGQGNSVGVTQTQETEIAQAPQEDVGASGGGDSSAEGGVDVSADASPGVCRRDDIYALMAKECQGDVLSRVRGSRPGSGGGGSVVVTSSDAQRVVAQGSGIVRQPPGSRALVSKVVIVYTSGADQVVDTVVGGSAVRVVATPVSYTWSWGDGTLLTTTDAGAPWPDHTVFHKYSATAQGVRITLTTTWRATYSVDGGPARAVAGVLTTTDRDEPFDLVRLQTYLTDQGEEAQGH